MREREWEPQVLGDLRLEIDTHVNPHRYLRTLAHTHTGTEAGQKFLGASFGEEGEEPQEK